MTRAGKGERNERHGIEVEGLVRQFKDVRAVDGIDLHIEPGQIYGFLGPNGAGKSTTVHMLTTLLPPTSGRATVNGFDIVKQGPEVRASIGAALQEAALDPVLTGREHLLLQATLQGLGKPDRQRRSQLLPERGDRTRGGDQRRGSARPAAPVRRVPPGRQRPGAGPAAPGRVPAGRGDPGARSGRPARPVAASASALAG